MGNTVVDHRSDMPMAWRWYERSGGTWVGKSGRLLCERYPLSVLLGDVEFDSPKYGGSLNEEDDSSRVLTYFPSFDCFLPRAPAYDIGESRFDLSAPGCSMERGRAGRHIRLGYIFRWRGE